MLQTSVPGETRPVTGYLTDGDVVRMLIIARVRRQNDFRPEFANHPGNGDCILGSGRNVTVASHIQKVDPGSDDLGCSSCLFGPFLRSSRTRGLSFGTDEDPDLVPGFGFLYKDGRAPELDVVGMWADGKNTHEFSVYRDGPGLLLGHYFFKRAGQFSTTVIGTPAV